MPNPKVFNATVISSNEQVKVVKENLLYYEYGAHVRKHGNAPARSWKAHELNVEIPKVKNEKGEQAPSTVVKEGAKPKGGGKKK